MRKSRFSEEQIIGNLKQAEAGVAVSELCRCKPKQPESELKRGIPGGVRSS